MTDKRFVVVPFLLSQAKAKKMSSSIGSRKKTKECQSDRQKNIAFNGYIFFNKSTIFVIKKLIATVFSPPTGIIISAYLFDGSTNV